MNLTQTNRIIRPLGWGDLTTRQRYKYWWEAQCTRESDGKVVSEHGATRKMALDRLAETIQKMEEAGE